MAKFYTNSTFDELMSMIPDPMVKEAFDTWDERKKNRLVPYTVRLDNKIVKSYGDLQSVDGQKSITYETTYGDVISLKGKRRPKTTNLNFIIEYDHERDNEAEMHEEVAKLEKLKKDRKAIVYSVSELNIDYKVTIETLTIVYKGVRDIYIRAELMEVYEGEDEYSNR